MTINTEELLALPVEEKLRLVELLWDNIGDETTPIPVPEWAQREALRRREEARQDPSVMISHEETWKRIRERNGA